MKLSTELFMASRRFAATPSTSGPSYRWDILKTGWQRDDGAASGDRWEEDELAQGYPALFGATRAHALSL